MNIKITADSTSDLSKELIKKWDVAVFPLYIVKAGEYFKDGVDISPKDIYAHVDAGGELCSTAAINVGDYTEYFRPLSEKYDAVIHINISADFSSCYQNACIAAQDFKNVYVVDSRNLSTGHGHVVLEACELAAKGMDAPEICAALAEFTPRVNASFILDRLDYMKKGGRCSAVTAFGANLLKLRPCIEVTDGKMHAAKKYRGQFDKCMVDYITDRLKDRADLRRDRIFITHSGISKELSELAVKTVKECGSFENIYVTQAGCTVSGHCGDNCIGVLYIENL